MSNLPSGWRAERRESARAVILEAAWALVRDEGLAGLSMRDLARRAGTTTPTLYKYFASKNEIYDAMFAQGAAAFEQVNGAPYSDEEPRAVVIEGFRRFIEFCTSDVPRYQLLFLRTIPGFVPSSEAYAPAVRALEDTLARLARNQITHPRHLDLWTALTTGLVDQQISNDPGGDRWTRLAEEAVDMFLAYCRSEANTSTTKETRRPRQ
jgi:AcrR family transcriptional regulator